MFVAPGHATQQIWARVYNTGNFLTSYIITDNLGRCLEANSADLFADGLDEFFDEGHACPTDGKDRYATFTGHGSRFVDDVSAWQTVEPALDFSAIAGYALALTR